MSVPVTPDLTHVCEFGLAGHRTVKRSERLKDWKPPDRRGKAAEYDFTRSKRKTESSSISSEDKYAGCTALYHAGTWQRRVSSRSTQRRLVAIRHKRVAGTRSRTKRGHYSGSAVCEALPLLAGDELSTVTSAGQERHGVSCRDGSPTASG